MGWQAWFTLGVLTVMLGALVRSLLPPDVTFMGGLVLVVAAGVITPKVAFHGLSNPAVVSVGALFIVAAGLRETGALHVAVARLLGQETSVRSALGRMLYPAAGLSAFMNNTPIVALLMSEIMSWCRKRDIAPSKMLIPLSYATMLGGMCTLIGTSTNLVVSGMMVESDLAPMALFDLAPLGVPAALVGITFLLIVAPHLLPDRKELLARLGEARREYIVELIVQPNCSLIGRSIQAAGLRNLPGLFLIEIDRRGQVLSPVAPSETLEADDRLVFTGMVQTIVDLQRIPGLVPAAEKHYDLDPAARRRRRLCEAVVSSSFPELGKSIRNSDFRTRYDAVVVAVHRNGTRLRKKIGDIVLRPGDTLLIQAGEHFERTFRGSTDFYLVSEVEDSAPVQHERAWVAITVMALFVGLLLLSVSTAVAALIAAALMVLTRCVPIGLARRAVDWQVLVVIAAALGFGEAIRVSQLASVVANALVSTASTWGGTLGVLLAIYLLTNLVTECVSNVAAAAIVFPVAMTAADMLGVDARPLALAVAIAASASFATPMGYQTNLMVYGPGGYRFSDFLRVGAPLNVLVMVVVVATLSLIGWSH